jgi:anti-sigma B factor antagonist
MKCLHACDNQTTSKPVVFCTRQLILILVNVPAAVSAPAARNKECTLKLSLEARRSGDVIIVHCEGRIVYRNEAAALSRVAREALQHTREVVLDLEDVQSMDSAGLGELVFLHMSAEGQGKSVKLAGPKRHVRELLELTNLVSVFDLHDTLEEIIAADDALAENA